MLVVGVFYFENIKADRKIRINRIKIDDVIKAVLRNGGQQVARKLTMRIYDRDTAAGLYVLDREIAQQRRLAGSGLSYHVHVLEAVFVFDAENLVRPAE